MPRLVHFLYYLTALTLAIVPTLSAPRPVSADQGTFSNNAGLSIPDLNPTMGEAGGSGAQITVPATSATIEKVTVRLENLSHSRPSDLDIALRSPAGQLVMLMSDVGGSNPINVVTLTLDDAAALPLPTAGQI